MKKLSRRHRWRMSAEIRTAQAPTRSDQGYAKAIALGLLTPATTLRSQAGL